MHSSLSITNAANTSIAHPQTITVTCLTFNITFQVCNNSGNSSHVLYLEPRFPTGKDLRNQPVRPLGHLSGGDSTKTYDARKPGLSRITSPRCRGRAGGDTVRCGHAGFPPRPVASRSPAVGGTLVVG
jgi:hypothetical protein